MTVNGRPRWTCRTLVATVAKGGGLTLSPLANMPVIRDLVADMTGFFDKWRRAKGRFIAAKSPIAAMSRCLGERPTLGTGWMPIQMMTPSTRMLIAHLQVGALIEKRLHQGSLLPGPGHRN